MLYFTKKWDTFQNFRRALRRIMGHLSILVTSFFAGHSFQIDPWYIPYNANYQKKTRMISSSPLISYDLIRWDKLNTFPLRVDHLLIWPGKYLSSCSTFTITKETLWTWNNFSEIFSKDTSLAICLKYLDKLH